MDDKSVTESICVVNKTDSEKSIATTNAASQEGRDGSSGKSRRTYVLDAGSGSSGRDSPSPPPQPALLYDTISFKSTAGVSPQLAADAVEARADASDAPAEGEPSDDHSETALQEYLLLAQETFTQTSKTILELAQTNCVQCYRDTSAIETQTSRVSIFGNKIIEYRIEVTGSQTRFTRNEIPASVRGRSGAPLPPAAAAACPSRAGSDDSDTLRIIDDELDEIERSDASDYYTSKYDTDFTDSLEDDRTRPDDLDKSDGSVPKSVDRDVEELYTNLEKSFDLRTFERPVFDIPRHAALSPLSEETIATKSLAPRRGSTRTQPKESPHRKTLTTAELRIDQLSIEGESTEQWKLPPISQQQRVSSPRRRPYSPGPRARTAAPRAPGAATTSDWAAGESSNLATKIGFVAPADPHRLPSLRVRASASRGDGAAALAPARSRSPETISIGGKIQQLKMPPVGKRRQHYPPSTTESRSLSPASRGSPGSPGSPAIPGSPGERCGGAGADVAARGCEALCLDVIARLRHACSCARMTFEQLVSRYESSDSCGAKWAAAVEVLEDIPRLFRGFWSALPEHRVADLLRLVTAHVESPRTRVARAACAAVAELLSHTGYTKKPEFDEAVTALLGKTGSMASALRRAANLALDQIVAAAAPAPAITSLCLFGAEHKSGLVRCAAARLLVVAAALAAGGRALLRARPRSAADARRLALRALAALLDDRSQDTRKYAERLYALLRPLPGFEAFFLADVEARTACRLMKKLDPLVALPAPPPPPPPR